MFFFEKKNQKTFNSALAARWRAWHADGELRGNKSLLLLFFRKEGLAFFTFASLEHR
jgi:hypothetical protein